MEESEILVTAIVGMIGIRPTIAAIKAGKDIALANKVHTGSAASYPEYQAVRSLLRPHTLP